MEFSQKLQELRKQKGLTQEELAKSLYVSRTAISKWESGRGYPSIDSLKEIAKFFSVTVDELLSTDEVLTIAQEERRQAKTYFRNLAFGLLDLCIFLLFVLPLFANRADGMVRSTSLLLLDTVQPWLKVSYIVVAIALIATGILSLALQACKATRGIKSNTILSLSVSITAVLLFMISLQPYAAILTFVLLAIKVLLLVKRA